MPQFSQQPPKETHQHSFRLIRTPASPPFKGFVISDKLVGCPTHYVGNRTVPCEQNECEPCENGIGWRWHGYLLVMVQASAEIVIYEMTATAAEKFTEYYQRHDTLRGCHFQASRVNNRPNGRVLVIAKPADLNQIHLPKDIDVKKLLSHIWNIAPSQVTRAPRHERLPAETIRIDRSTPELDPHVQTFKTITDRQTSIEAGNGNRKEHRQAQQRG